LARQAIKIEEDPMEMRLPTSVILAVVVVVVLCLAFAAKQSEKPQVPGVTPQPSVSATS
jgi:hypothetical protein